MIPGAVMWGRISDLCGRRPAMVATLICMNLQFWLIDKAMCFVSLFSAFRQTMLLVWLFDSFMVFWMELFLLLKQLYQKYRMNETLLWEQVPFSLVWQLEGLHFWNWIIFRSVGPILCGYLSDPERIPFLVEHFPIFEKVELCWYVL